MRTKFFILFALSLVFASCELEKEIDYNFYYDGDKIVVHGFIGQVDGVKAIVKKTLSPLNTQGSSYLSNPEVWLCEDGKPFVKLVETDSSLFKPEGNYSLTPGKAYTLSVKANGLPDVVSCPQYLINPLTIDTVFNSRIAYTSSIWYIAIWIRDNLEETNYFGFKINRFKNGENIDFSNELQMLPRISADFDYPEHVIKTEYQMNMIHRVYLEQEIDSFQVILYTVSKDYYDFDQSMDYFDYSYGSSFNEHIYPVKSNITGGYGFFCSYETTKYGSTGR